MNFLQGLYHSQQTYSIFIYEFNLNIGKIDVCVIIYSENTLRNKERKG